jgi:uncharacterized protein YjbI with pentapeptide repeats
MALRRLALW